MGRIIRVMAVSLILLMSAGAVMSATVISDVKVAKVYGTTAVVTWTTDTASSSRVTYDKTTPPSTYVSDSSMVTSHRMVLTGLDACSTYYFSVTSNDGSGAVTDDNGGSYYTILTGQDTQIDYISTDVPQTIPMDGSVTSYLDVSDTRAIDDIEVTIGSILQEQVYTLSLYLVAPDNTVIPLSLGAGYYEENDYADTIFDDEAATYIQSSAVSAPFTGAFKPNGQLSRLIGKSAAGRWYLRAENVDNTVDGTIESWGLSISFPYKYCTSHLTFTGYFVTDVCTGIGNGDDDGIVDPGEEITLRTTVYNDGNAIQTSTSGVLSTTTTGVTVTDNSASFTTPIAMEASGTSLSNHFGFKVDDITMTCATEIDFNLHLSSTQRPSGWDETFTVPIGEVSPAGGTVLFEDFTLGIPATWSIVNGGTGGEGPPDAHTWTADNPCRNPDQGREPPLNEPYAEVDSFCAGETATQDEQLITPVMNLSAADGVTLSFDQGFYYWSEGLYEVGDVDVRSSLTSGEWVNVLRNEYPGCQYNCISSPTIDIGSYAAGASDVQVRFRYYNAAWDNGWVVDNVKVTYTIDPQCSMNRCCPTMTAASIGTITDDNVCSQSGITIPFTAASPATRHDLYVDDVLVQSGVTTPISYNPGDKNSHSYVIRAVNGYEDCYINSSSQNFTDEDQTPSKPSITNITDDDACAQSGIKIYYSAGSPATLTKLVVGGSEVATMTGSPYSYNPGDTASHTYVVRTYNNTCHNESNSQAFSDANVKPGAPTITGIADVDACATSGIKVSFTAGSPVGTSYNLVRDGSVVVTGYASGATYSPGDNSSHNYIVRAVVSSCTTDSTAMAGTDVNDKPGAPTITGIVDVDACATTGIKVSFTAGSPAGISYNLVRDGSVVVTGYTSGATYTPGDNSSHNYIVRAIKNTCTTDSNILAGTDVNDKPGQPVITGIVDVDACATSGIQVSFTAGTPAGTSYNLVRDGSVVVTGYTSGATYTPGDNASHSYVVRALKNVCLTDSVGSAFSDADNTPGTPLISGVVDLDGCISNGVQITWNTVSGATGYDLYDNATTIVADVTSPYVHIPSDSSIHNYQIRAKNAICTGAWSSSGGASYTNSGGSGDRTASITVASNIAVGTLSQLVNGNTTAGSVYLTGAVSGKYISFDFGTGAAKIITEAKFYQGGTQTHGTWVWQGSNDGSTWTDIGANFTLGGIGTQTITTLSSNLSAFRYYRIWGVSGTASSAPWIYEFEFKIYGTWSGTDANGTPGAPTITAVNDVDACALSGVQVVYTGGSGATSHNLYDDGSLAVTGYVSGATYNPGNTSSHSYVIRAISGTCHNDSPSQSGTDANGMPGAPSITGITDVSVCSQSGIQVSFDAGSPAGAGYNLLRDGSVVVTGYVSGTTYNPGDTSSHTYVVQAVNGVCTINSTGSDFADADNTPGVPTVTGTADKDACVSDGVIITWNAVSGATGYDLYVDGTTIVSDVTSPHTYLPGDANSHSYQVRAKNGTCPGSWSVSGATSYTNAGGSGDRTAAITVASNIAVGTLSQLVNGNTTAGSVYLTGAVSGKYISFDFGTGAAKIITEAKFYQSTTNSHGTWVWQGSNDGSTWTGLGASFTLGGVATQTITTLSVNSTAYRYYRILGISGTASSAPWIYEFEFKINPSGVTVGLATDANGTPGAPSITGVTDVSACAQSGVQVVYTAGSGAASHNLYDNGSLAVTGYTSGATYNPGNTSSHTYIVRAINGTCYADSPSQAGTDANNTPGAPTITSVNDVDACAQSGVQVVYTAGSGAASHNLYDNGSLVVTGYASGATYNPGNTSSHTYIVRAVSGTCYNDSPSQSGTDANGTPGAPAITSITDENNCSLNGIRVYFTPGTGAASHDLYKDTVLAVTGYTTGAIYIPGDGSSHAYVVRAVNGTCHTDSSSQSYADINDTVGSPSIDSIADNDGCAQSGIRIYFTAGSGALQHDLYRDGSVVKNNYASGDLYNPGDTSSHSYVIRAVKGNCYNNSSSQPATDANGTPGAPAITAVNDVDVCAQSGVQVVYTAGSGAASHDLYDNGSLAVTSYASGATYNPGDTASHTYIVRAINGTCYTNSPSMAGTDASNTTGAPTITAVNDVDACAQSGVQVVYTAGSGATSHNLYDNGSLAVTGYASGATYNPGDTASHTYIVRAINGTCFTNSPSLAGTDANNTPGVPTVTGTADKDACVFDGVIITWDAVSGATGYDLYVDGTTIVSDVTSPHTYLPGDANSHSYQVRAKSGTCPGSWSVSGATSYTNAGGSGDRTAGITVASNIAVGTLSQLVNGNTVSSSVYLTGAVAGKYISFDFGTGAAKIITEAKFYQGGTQTHGTWVWQGSNDGSTWTGLGASFTLGGVATQTITTLSVNSTAYRYYRVLGISGTASSAPWIYEFEFKINPSGVTVGLATDANGTPSAPTLISVVDNSGTACDGVVVTFTAGSPATQTNLWRDGAQVATNINSPYLYVPGDSSSHSYVVRTYNGVCYTDSGSAAAADVCGACVAPTDRVVETVNTDKTGFKWADIAGADFYRVVRGLRTDLATYNFTGCVQYGIASGATGVNISSDDPSGVAGRCFYYIVQGYDCTDPDEFLGPAGDGVVVRTLAATTCDGD